MEESDSIPNSPKPSSPSSTNVSPSKTFITAACTPVSASKLSIAASSSKESMGSLNIQIIVIHLRLFNLISHCRYLPADYMQTIRERRIMLIKFLCPEPMDGSVSVQKYIF